MIDIEIDKQNLVEGDTLEEGSTQIVLAQDYCCTFLALIVFSGGFENLSKEHELSIFTGRHCAQLHCLSGHALDYICR